MKCIGTFTIAILLAGSALFGQASEPVVKLSLLEVKTEEKTAVLTVGLEATHQMTVLLDERKFSLSFYADGKEYFPAELRGMGTFLYQATKVADDESERLDLNKKKLQRYSFYVQRVPYFFRAEAGSRLVFVEREHVNFNRAVLRFRGTNQIWDGEKIVVDKNCWNGVAEAVVEGATLKELLDAVVAAK